MANNKVQLRTYTHFKNPEPKHYQQSQELRPDDRLIDSELKVWDRITPVLALYDRLDPLNLDTLVEYCRVIAKLDQLSRFLRENDDTYESETRNGIQIKMRPEVGQLNECRRMLRSYTGDFGLTPAANKHLGQLDLFSDDLGNGFIALERETREYTH